MAELTLDSLIDDGNYLGSERARLENKAILDELERKKKARNMAVPTDDNRVRARLRELGEPITLFGERQADRRDRLIYVLSQINAARGDDVQIEEESSDESADEAGSVQSEGHSKEVYSVEFQDDGSLVASGGLDAIGRVWDLRTGRTAMVLDGHVQAIFGIAFSPNGYQIATGAGDDTIRIWDIRSLKALYTIPAHVSNVSDVRFFRSDDLPPMRLVNGDGDTKMNDEEDADESNDKADETDTAEEWRYRSGLYFASAGYDGFVKLWSADDWQLLRTLTTDSGKVMTVDLSSDGSLLASGTYNRNFQLFAPEDVAV
ncbi:hypothetical protein ID866_4491 [Astraeus odoratus]|nr:hypothetical protein ID866_4491 [Astraeus odoratus]